MGPYCWSLALPLFLGAAQDELQPGWKTITSKEGGFNVSMPAEPMLKKQPVKTATGILNVMMYIADGRNDANFVVSYCDIPASDVKKEIDKRLDQARDGAVARVRGSKLRSEEVIKLKGHPGRDIVIEKDGEVVVKMRIYLVKGRLYQVMVLGNGPVFATKDVSNFLDSFRLNE